MSDSLVSPVTLSRPALDLLLAEVAQFATAVDRLRALVQVYKAASLCEMEGTVPALYWPYLVELLEAVLPAETALEQAAGAVAMQLG